MKSWIKGGLIGIIIAVVYSIGSIILIFNDHIFHFDFSLITAPFFIIAMSCRGSYCIWLLLILIPVILAIISFIVGAIIGRIIGRFKNKNREVNR